MQRVRLYIGTVCTADHAFWVSEVEAKLDPHLNDFQWGTPVFIGSNSTNYISQSKLDKIMTFEDIDGGVRKVLVSADRKKVYDFVSKGYNEYLETYKRKLEELEREGIKYYSFEQNIASSTLEGDMEKTMNTLLFEFGVYAVELIKNTYHNVLEDWVHNDFLYNLDKVLPQLGISEDSEEYRIIYDSIEDDDILSCVTIDKDSMAFKSVKGDKLLYTVNLIIDKEKLLKLCEQ